jgi:hypothetical protein
MPNQTIARRSREYVLTGCAAKKLKQGIEKQLQKEVSNAISRRQPINHNPSKSNINIVN